MGKQMLANAASNSASTLLSGLNNKGHAEGTTRAAVADGTIIVRDQSRQTQDVSALSRDIEHASDSISAIFDKEKEQKRLQTAQLAGEISGQMTNIVTTMGDIKGLEKAQSAKNAETLPAGATEKQRGEWLEKMRDSPEYQAEMKQWGIGSTSQKVAQTVGSILTGLVTGNAGQAVAGGLNPWAAQLIKKETTDASGNVDVAANAMAHAVWGAVSSQMSGGSAAAGAAGAFSGELATRYIAEKYWGADTPEKIAALGQEDREQLSLLGTLAAGLAGGMAGNSSAAATSGAIAGKNAVENNSLGDIAQAQSEGKTLEQKAGEQVEAENERYKEANCGGMSVEACSVKMYTERREALKDMASAGAEFGSDFIPVYGDIKSFAEAQSALDYLAAAIGIIPGAGDAAGKVIKAAETALKKGDVAEASRLINEGSQQISAKAKDVQIWTETKKKEPVSNAYGHWDKHKQEFPELQNSKQYVEATHSFVNNPPPGTLSKVRSNGETVFYNPKTNTFAVKTADGVPKTMFRPDPSDHGFKTNLDYFNAQ
ncbi:MULTISPECIES: VENN motif pre-toxin domain-containing protein [unclassified Pantoea]|uniref:VENN motif pre-toxin domain-containing protein n=1 Tax=unclassified Pantoea TaxID=2630326 RepID=UPI002477C3A2|nr:MULTISPECIES: VENN motif pre-toxin domain-containing protein [unclassified Pantoea]GME30529.1 hypothetical protein ACJ3_05740 [Pantoea sp. QMID3]GME30836.1 hypothetical protein ACJ1_05720 [Pantoea sp. QMID1]GME50722.1 hypothetical protein ACJ4_05750 [Pantoea sp. QMID4]GME51991.1 hypothetical protein ACJ2_05730 [Pantoea sp. QMID2]